MFVLVFLLSAIWQIGRQTAEYTVWNVIPLVPDVDTMVSGKLRAGAFAAVQTFTRKVTGALGSALIGWILTLSGFNQHASVQSGSAKMGIMVAFALVPIVCFIYSLYLARTFNLDQHSHKIIKDEINRLQAGGSKADVDPDTKRVVEDLTGYRYEDVWKTGQ